MRWAIDDNTMGWLDVPARVLTKFSSAITAPLQYELLLPTSFYKFPQSVSFSTPVEVSLTGRALWYILVRSCRDAYIFSQYDLWPSVQYWLEGVPEVNKDFIRSVRTIGNSQHELVLSNHSSLHCCTVRSEQEFDFLICGANINFTLAIGMDTEQKRRLRCHTELPYEIWYIDSEWNS